MNVLIIEDNKAMATKFKEIFTGAGFKTRRCDTAEEALEMLDTAPVQRVCFKGATHAVEAIRPQLERIAKQQAASS